MKKKLVLMMSVLFTFGLFNACSSDDNLGGIGEGNGNAQKGDNPELVVDSVHFFQDIKAPYIPISNEDTPKWLKPFIENSRKGSVNMTVIRGRRNWQYVYNVHDDQMNIQIGFFYDQDGNRLEDIGDIEAFIYETLDWTCIINYKYY